MGADTSNMLGSNVRIPEWWSKPGVPEELKQTKTKLGENRRAEKVPHISYDLDGDGFVGGRDYVIAKQFDKDGDGRLNTNEKKAAIDALKQGYENNYVWNVEVSGGQRPYRLLQKRGVIVDAEDFLPVRDTYPVHPDTLKKPAVTNVSELKDKRKKEYLDSINEQKKRWEAANPAAIEMPFIKSEFLVDKPKFTSINQRKEEEKQEARRKAGLEQTITDVKDTNKDPSIKFVENPKTYSKTLLDAQRKEEMLNQLKQLETNIGNFKDIKGRLEDREACYLRLGYKETQGKTKKQIEEERKIAQIENMTQKFGNVTVGIHGQELPKFSGDQQTKEFWKFSQTFQDEPAWTSSVEMKENSKFWAKNDDIRLADVQPNHAPTDPFKTQYAPQQLKNDVASKIHTINHWKRDQDEQVNDPQFTKGYTKAVKWSEQEKFYRCVGEDRLFDKLIKNAETYEQKIEESQKKKQELTVRSPIKNPINANHYTQNGGVDSSRINQSYQKINENDISHVNGGDIIKIQPKTKENQPVESALSHANNSRINFGNQQIGQNGTQNLSQQNLSGLSFVGKSTLFSRMALSPQPDNKKTLGNKLQNNSINNTNNNNSLGGNGISMMQTNNQSTTINNSSLMKTMRSTNSTFRDTVQRGVLSGIGLLKK